MGKRQRRVSSIKNELLVKSKEALRTAIQIFNNPQILFKSESFTVLAIIAWTYLLHAYYRKEKIEYRYFTTKRNRRLFNKTKFGAYKNWELERCLDDELCPIDIGTSSNLRFLIGLRHEVEHQMTTRIDDLLSAKFQACCLNYNTYLKQLFGAQHGIEKHLSFSLQLSSLSEPQTKILMAHKDLPAHISSYIANYEDTLTDDVYNNPRYAYRVWFVQKVVNNRGQADQVTEFIPYTSELAHEVNSLYIIKEKEKVKYLPSDIWRKAQEEGYTKFKSKQHADLWKKEEAKLSAKGFGVLIANKWYWYETWLKFVLNYCDKNRDLYQ